MGVGIGVDGPGEVHDVSGTGHMSHRDEQGADTKEHLAIYKVSTASESFIQPSTSYTKCHFRSCDSEIQRKVRRLVDKPSVTGLRKALTLLREPNPEVHQVPHTHLDGECVEI